MPLHGQSPLETMANWTTLFPGHPDTAPLNDEANLIYASKKGNNDKLERFYTLSNLHTHYKQKIFGTADDGVIEKKIVRNNLGCGQRGSLSLDDI